MKMFVGTIMILAIAQRAWPQKKRLKPNPLKGGVGYSFNVTHNAHL